MRSRMRTAEDEEAPIVTGVVSAITAAGRRPGRFEVAVDGKVAAVVSVEIVERLGLRVGATLDERGGRALREASGMLATYDRAVGLLAVQGRSARELERKLKQRGEPAANVTAAVARLTEQGLLDDATYARQLARSRVSGRGDSRRRVSQVLAQKGVARDVVQDAVSEVFEDEAVDEEALAESAGRKKLRTLGALDAETRRRRLYGYLARRGHDADVIRRVMARVLAEGAGDEPIEDAEEGGEE
jgi:regulatory protein